jgi:hypothetical protein
MLSPILFIQGISVHEGEGNYNGNIHRIYLERCAGMEV